MSAVLERRPATSGAPSDRLAAAIAAAKARVAADVVPLLGDGVCVPASDEQRQVWLDAARHPDVVLYNEPVTLHRYGSFDRAVFERAFRAFVLRHGSLRTSFAIEDDVLLQTVHPDPAFAVPYEDLSGLEPRIREAEATRIAEEDARRPFRLDRAPLFRLRILRMAEDRHRIQIVLHHVVFDGVSIYGIVAPELTEIYEAFEAGRKPSLPPSGIQYADYSAWKATRPHAPASMDHWRRVFAERPDEAVLPTDRPRPAVATGRGSMSVFELDADTVERARAVGRERGCTLYMTLLASFKTLLHRYGADGDLVVGGVADTRRRPDLSRTLGYFLNSFAMRSHPLADQPFSRYLAEIRDVVVASLDAGDVPFDRVVRELGIRPSADRHPLFQILFSMEPPAPMLPEGWELTQMDATVGIAKFDLYLELDERPEGGMAARFLYSDDLFDPETIRSMEEHWKAVLGAVLADPDIPLGEVRLTSDADEARMAREDSGPVRSVPDVGVHDLFLARAEASPDAVAVRCGGRVATYAELRAMARAGADRLRSTGVGPGHLVGVATDRSVEMVADLLAVAMSGAAWLPLDVLFPADRLDAILDDARPVTVLGGEVLGPRAVPRPADADGDPRRAYVIYTSGSTGRPKGVEVSHASLVNLILSMADDPGFGPGDAMFALTTISFDIAALELFLPLSTGGTLVLAPSGIASDPVAAAGLLSRSGCTVVQGTPTTFRSLLLAGWRPSPDVRVWCGGERLPTDLADELAGACARLSNMYGPTETTVWSMTGTVRPGKPVRLGRPVANTVVAIVDSSGRRVPDNVEGELAIAGAGLAIGYRDPDLTERRFVEMSAFGARAYRTGDVARRRRDGSYEWLRRDDGQLKIRGFRIECGDVEAALLSHPDVASAAAKAEDGGTVLAAYYVAAAPGRPDPAELRRILRGSLPEYMVPSRLVRLDAMPTTPNGKIDRKALRPVDGAVDGVPVRSVRTPTDRERLLMDLFSEILGIAEVGPDDDFFDLGGHSLLGVRLLRTVEKRHGVRLPASALARTPTAAGLAATIFSGRDGSVDRIFSLAEAEGGTRFYWIDAVPGFRPRTFASVAAAMGPSFSVWGVSNGIDERSPEEAPSGIREIAESIAADVAGHSRTGEIVLGGYCNGGVLAYEAARILESSGRSVPVVVLVDTVNPADRPSAATVLRQHAKVLGSTGRKGLLPTAADIAGIWWRGLVRRASSAVSVDGRLLSSGQEAVAKAVAPYRPRRFAGRVVLLQSEDAGFCIDGWRGAPAREVISADVPGRHVSIMRQPHATEVGRVVARLVERCGDDAAIAP